MHPILTITAGLILYHIIRAAFIFFRRKYLFRKGEKLILKFNQELVFYETIKILNDEKAAVESGKRFDAIADELNYINRELEKLK